jgi:hypothetical protein
MLMSWQAVTDDSPLTTWMFGEVWTSDAPVVAV